MTFNSVPQPVFLQFIQENALMAMPNSPGEYWSNRTYYKNPEGITAYEEWNCLSGGNHQYFIPETPNYETASLFSHLLNQKS